VADWPPPEAAPAGGDPNGAVARTRDTCDAPPVLKCEECGCNSESAKDWRGYIAEDPEDGEGPVVVTYCPPCAAREQQAPPAVDYI
jgi:hypothetical protein